MRFPFLVLIYLLFFCSLNATETVTEKSQPTALPLSFSLSYGGSYSLPSPLSIEQEGHEEISLWGDFETFPFEIPLYWAIRVRGEFNQIIWELETIHLKLRLLDPPPEIEQFEISHGYNLTYVNIVLPVYNAYYLHLGLGGALPHPENVIRGKRLPGDGGLLSWGYYFTGPAVQVAFSKSYELHDYFYLNMESKFTLGYARVPIVDGHADIVNGAFQLLLGLGVNLF